jgi:Zn-dependent protease
VNSSIRVYDSQESEGTSASAATTLILLAVYAWKFGWEFAAGFATLILCQQAGHFFAARLRGLRVSIPALASFGAPWIRLHDAPRNAETLAYVAIGGPIAGGLASLACLYCGHMLESHLLIALADLGLLLTLLNVLPLAPFAGYHIAAAVCPGLQWLGLPLLAVLYWWYFPEPLLILAGFAVITTGYPEHGDGYFAVQPGQRAGYAAVYVLLASLLALLHIQLHSELSTPVDVVVAEDEDDDPPDELIQLSTARESNMSTRPNVAVDGNGRAAGAVSISVELGAILGSVADKLK